MPASMQRREIESRSALARVEGPSAQPQSELGTSPGDAFPPDFCRVLNREVGRAVPGWPEPLEACLVANWGEEVGSS